MCINNAWEKTRCILPRHSVSAMSASVRKRKVDNSKRVAGKCGKKRVRVVGGGLPGEFGSYALGVRHNAVRRFTYGDCVGRGANGAVYKIKLDQGAPCGLVTKRFYSPELSSKEVQHLLREVPAAFDILCVAQTRMVYTEDGLWALIQEECSAINFQDADELNCAISALKTLPSDLLRHGVAHGDIKGDNIMWGPGRKHIKLVDTDSMLPITNEPRHNDVAICVGAYSQYLFGLTHKPKDLIEALQFTRHADADWHLQYETVQRATMEFSCLMTVLNESSMPGSCHVVWPIAAKTGVLDNAELRRASVDYPEWAETVIALWQDAVKLMRTEPRAYEILGHLP